jgi:hypothetical protein
MANIFINLLKERKLNSLFLYFIPCFLNWWKPQIKKKRSFLSFQLFEISIMLLLNWGPLALDLWKLKWSQQLPWLSFSLLLICLFQFFSLECCNCWFFLMSESFFFLALPNKKGFLPLAWSVAIADSIFHE